jgi:tetratricopeptide (TPR) repeat protein
VRGIDGRVEAAVIRRLWTRSLCVAALAVTLGACAGTSFGSSQRNPDSLYGNYLAARYAGTLRDMDAAADYYAQALAEDPGNPVIVERAFLLSVTSGDIAMGLSLAGQIIERDPDNRTARLVRSLSALKSEKYDLAIEEIEAAAPGPFTALVGTLVKSWAAAGKQDTDLTYSILDGFRERPAFDLFRVFHEGLIADYLNDASRARAAYLHAQESSGRASLRIVQAYGRYLERQGDTDLAREVFRNYARLAPDHPIIEAALERVDAGRTPSRLAKTPAEGLSEALYGLSAALAQESGIDISILYVQLALYLRPDFDVARTLLADLFERGERREDANVAYGKVSRSSPLYENAQIQIALNLDRLNSSNEAAARLRTLIRQFPQSIEPLTALGDILRGGKEYGEAVKQYSAAIALSGEPDARSWTLHYARGMCYERLKQWSLAEKDLRLALELSDGHPLVLNYLGYSWIEQNINLQDAMEMIRRAVELRPDDGYIVDSLGWAHYQIGEYDEAVKHLERAVQLQPDDATINDHLGDAFWRAGRKIEARFQWQHALEMEPEPDQIELIQNKLENGLEEVGAGI